MHVLVIGAGIGGLSVALCLRHQGLRVTVVERSHTLGEVGAGIQVPPNASRVLRALGLLDAVRARAVIPERVRARLGQGPLAGRTVFTLPLGEAAERRWGAPYLHVHRADLVAVLAQALRARGGELRLGADVEEVEPGGGEGGGKDGDGPARVRLQDGGEVLEADAVVAADGLRSPTREALFSPEPPRFAGHFAWRATVPLEGLETPPAREATLWMGRGAHAVTYLLRPDRSGEPTLANFVGVVEASGGAGDPAAESWRRRGARADALADFAGWHPEVRALVRAAPQLHQWALFDRAPLGRWVRGRVALLGDAAHPMLPFQAQGAAMAVEDAWVVARELAGAEGAQGVNAALRAYAQKRQARTARAQGVSRGNARTFHQGGLAALGVYGAMAVGARLVPGLLPRRFDWLYGEDVTEDVTEEDVAGGAPG